MFLPYVGETTLSVLGRVVLFIWLFVVLIVKSSYTASLSSIQTVQQLYSPVTGIESLMESKYPIGYQKGSFSGNYLHEELHFPKSQLVPLENEEAYAEALRKGPKKGGVVALVDDMTRIEAFLSRRCEFIIRGQRFTKNGRGFVSVFSDDYIPTILMLYATQNCLQKKKAATSILPESRFSCHIVLTFHNTACDVFSEKKDCYTNWIIISIIFP